MGRRRAGPFRDARRGNGPRGGAEKYHQGFVSLSTMEYLHEGAPQAVIDEARARQHVQALLAQLRRRGPLNRVLILPPDMTRLHSWAGFLTCELYEQLHQAAEVAILPAVGTHLAM